MEPMKNFYFPLKHEGKRAVMFLIILCSSFCHYAFAQLEPFQQVKVWDVESYRAKYKGYLYYSTGKELWRTDGKRPVKAYEFDNYIYELLVTKNFLVAVGINAEVWILTEPDEPWEKVVDARLSSGLVRNYTVNDLLFTFYSESESKNGVEAVDLHNGNITFLKYGISSILQLAESGGILYFESTGLWRTDGTVEGTYSLLDPGGDLLQLSKSTEGKVLLIADQPYLWMLDGTVEGTELLKQFESSPDYYSNLGRTFYTTSSFSYFTYATDPSHYELWKTDGTMEGTVKLDDFNYIVRAKLTGELLYFVERGNSNNLWVSDGTPSSTYRLTGGYDFSADWAVHAGSAYFSTYDGVTRRFWRATGKDLVLLKEGVRATDLRFIDGELFFLDTAGGLPALWRSNGTGEGTTLVRTLPLVEVPYPTFIKYPFIFDHINDALLVSALSESGDWELFKYDIDGDPPGCFATEVISFHQGKRKNGTTITGTRSDPAQALGKPQENDTYNFAALGFGGSIVLKFEEPVYDDGTAEPEIIMVETSHGRSLRGCISEGQQFFPEQAFVEVSDDGETWYGLPNSYCRTSFLDIKPAADRGMPYAQYIRITDGSDPSQFFDWADGYDLDGLITCREEVLFAKERLLDARTASSTTLYDENFYNRLPDYEDLSLHVYPNPVQEDELNIHFQSQENTTSNIAIYNTMGLEVFRYSSAVDLGVIHQKLDVSLDPGIYFLRLQTGGYDRTERFVVR